MGELEKKSVGWMATYWPDPGEDHDGIVAKFVSLSTDCRVLVVCRDMHSPERVEKGLSPRHYHAFIQLHVQQRGKWVKNRLFPSVNLQSTRARNADVTGAVKYVYGLDQEKEVDKEVVYSSIMDLEQYLVDNGETRANAEKRKAGDAFEEVADMVEAGKTNKEICSKHRKFYWYNYRMINSMRKQYKWWAQGSENYDPDDK